MTKKDFELIARSISEFNRFPGFDLDGAEKIMLAKIFANNLATTNPLFDRQRFLKACGIEGLN